MGGKSIFGLGLLIGLGAWFFSRPTGKIVQIPSASPRAQAPAAVEPVRAPATASSSTSLEAARDQMARQMESSQNSASAARVAVPQIDPAQVARMAKDVLDPRLTVETRRASLFMLTQAGMSARFALRDIAKAALPDFPNAGIPHSLDSYHQQVEMSLRVTALEALDQLAASGADVREALEAVLDTQKSDSLRTLATISLMGIEQNRPGKLGRFIDKLLNEGG